jgi:hypothetical protein
MILGSFSYTPTRTILSGVAIQALDSMTVDRITYRSIGMDKGFLTAYSLLAWGLLQDYTPEQ